MKISSLLFTITLSYERLNAFVVRPAYQRATILSSSVGGGSVPPSDNGAPGNWDDFLDPNREESEYLRRARELLSDSSLPISYDVINKNQSDDFRQDSNSSAITFMQGNPSADTLAENPYITVVSKLSPSEMISKFTRTAHPRVQNAVRTTILGLIGGLPKMAFDTTTITTGQRLASLMFQLQMTGYLFGSAQYRLSVQESFGKSGESATPLLAGSDDDDDEESSNSPSGKLRGKLRLRYSSKNTESSTQGSEAKGENPDSSFDVEVDAEAFTSELRSEVSMLREELMITRKEKQEALRKDLLAYIRTLPEKELQSLTSGMSQDVLVAMKGLVNAVLAGIGEGQIGPHTVTEQSGEAMAQLCMWQLVVGYNLRQMEVREQMKKSLKAGANNNSAIDNEENTQSPGAFE